MATTVMTTPAPAQDAALLRLRPRDVPGLFDQAVWLYRRNFRVFLGIAAIVQLPVTLLITLGTAWVLGPSSQLNFTNFTQPSADTQQATITALSDMLSRVSLLSSISLIGSVLLTLAEGALARAIADTYLGRPVTVWGAYRAMRPHAVWLMLGVLVQTVASYLILLPPLYIYIFVAWTFSSQVIVLENANIVTGLQRSWRLVQGQWWRTAGMNVLVLLIGAIIALPATLVSALALALGAPFLVASLASTAVSLVFSLIFLPARLAAFTLMYYDLRIRKEGYDLEVALAERMRYEV